MSMCRGLDETTEVQEGIELGAFDEQRKRSMGDGCRYCSASDMPKDRQSETVMRLHEFDAIREGPDIFVSRIVCNCRVAATKYYFLLRQIASATCRQILTKPITDSPLNRKTTTV